MPFRIIDVIVAGANYFSPRPLPSRRVGTPLRGVLVPYGTESSHRQNRYNSIVYDEDAYFKELVRYIHLNPLRAKLVKSLAQLDRYRWSTPPFN